MSSENARDIGKFSRHIPILVNEVLSFFELQTERDLFLIDATLGGGGHTEALLQRGRVFVLGIDRDIEAISRASARLTKFQGKFFLAQGNFQDLSATLQALPRDVQARIRETCTSRGESFVDGTDDAKENIRCDGILVDFGFSSDQLDNPERGFSFQADAPLDMRLDRSTGKTAADILNASTHGELVTIFRKGGLGAPATALASEVLNRRPISTTKEFSQLCHDVIYPKRGKGRQLGLRKHPATVPFQALRIEVNQELPAISGLLEQVPGLLADKGRFAAICFHSLEDKLVTQTLRRWSRPSDAAIMHNQNDSLGKLLTRHAIEPSNDEVAQNPRSRSALLRVFERQRERQLNEKVGRM